MPEYGAIVKGGDAGGDALFERVAGGGGEGEGFPGDFELPVVCGDGVGIEEPKESAGGEFGGGAAGEFGEGEDVGVFGAALAVSFSGENGGGEEE